MAGKKSSALKSADVIDKLTLGGRHYYYYSLAKAGKALGGATAKQLAQLPFCLKVLMENLLRHLEDGEQAPLLALANWPKEGKAEGELPFYPARILMQDLTGVPAIADLAALRDGMERLGGDPEKINPLIPVDMVIDHSVMMDKAGSAQALAFNVAREYERNGERYAFLRWGAENFANFRVAPPGAGICHQVNLEYLARVVFADKQSYAGRAQSFLWPDSLVGTDSHTTMINGLGILGWGVGGIEAEAAMLGQPIILAMPEVVGVKLEGKLALGTTATDLVLHITQLLRAKGVVGRFVEFYGPALAHLSLEDRATIANMAPEYGATCGFFPFDEASLAYLHLTGRSKSEIARSEAYMRAQGLFYHASTKTTYSDHVSVDLNKITASLAGPARPQDKVALPDAGKAFSSFLAEKTKTKGKGKSPSGLADGAVVLAAITSCTNTSNPHLMLGAGLLARNARKKGLKPKPWVKTSLAPGSQVVQAYLEAAQLIPDLEALGFHIAGFGCTTCIGNSGPLDAAIESEIKKNQLQVCSVLSGNRNFEGRIHPLVRANYLASPPLVVAYALAGTMLIDLTRDALGEDKNGKPVFLKDIWPDSATITELAKKSVRPALFRKSYQTLFLGDAAWQKIPAAKERLYRWDAGSTYIRRPPFLDKTARQPESLPPVKNAHILALLGDSITTDHISPAGQIAPGAPAAQWLEERQVPQSEFNSYGARRGNHEVMLRGTFANIRIRNPMAQGREGGWTKHIPSGKVLPIFEAASLYQEDDIPLVVIAGREYGTGSSRDWAAKGTKLLGVRAVLACSFERIHRSNLIGMGVLPLQFASGENAQTLGLNGEEKIDLVPPDGAIKPGQTWQARISGAKGTKTISLRARIDTKAEARIYHEGGILPYTLRRLR